MSRSINDSSLIFRTENRKVLRCACCNRIEVVFGNIAVAHEPALFRRFRRAVKKLNTDAEKCRIDSERPVLLSVDGDQLAFRFTREEVRELEELLDGAAATFELDEILDEELTSDRTP